MEQSEDRTRAILAWLECKPGDGDRERLRNAALAAGATEDELAQLERVHSELGLGSAEPAPEWLLPALRTIPVFARSRPRTRRWLAPLGAAALFALGLATGRWWDRLTPLDPPAQDQYMLLLNEAPGSWPPVAGSVREGYGTWARDLFNAGRYVTARKLSDDPGALVFPDGTVLRGDTVASMATVSGFYTIRAASYEEAIAEAQRSPHLRYGSSILVRMVDQ